MWSRRHSLRPAPRRLRGLITLPESLDAPAAVLQGLVHSFYVASPAGQTLDRILQGRSWLGHPLHPLLTDIVTGAYTVAWTFDILDSLGLRRLRPGADAAVAIGLAATPPTAMSGAADWRHTGDAPMRLGFVHAGLNALASLCYLASLVQRLRGRRRSGVVTSHFGFLVMNISAYLGGELVYEAAVGVRRPSTSEGDPASDLGGDLSAGHGRPPDVSTARLA